MSGKGSRSGSVKGSPAEPTISDHREDGIGSTNPAARTWSNEPGSTGDTTAAAIINSPIVAASATNAAAVATRDTVGVMNQVAGATRTAAVISSSSAGLVKPANPPPTHQVIVDVANKLNAISKGAVPKQAASTAESRSRLSLSNIRGKVVIRRNPERRARGNRYSSCEWCADKDNSRMVQCDDCDRWFHFSCVEVTQGIAEISWICPICPFERIEAQKQTPAEAARKAPLAINPPPKDSGDTRSCGKKSSQRSQQRKIDLKLQKLEEQKKLEQKFLEEKFKILEELEGDGETDLDDEELEKMSNVSQWIRDTDRGGAAQDSGVVEEDLPEESGIPTGLAEQSAPVDQRQVSQQRRLQGGRRNTLQEFAPGQRSTPRTLPTPRPTNPERIPTLPTPRSRTQPPQRPTPTGPTLPATEPEPIPAEETICILNRSQLAARQAVSKDLPEFAGNPEDWPLFFSMYTSSTQMCGFSNEENMLRLRKCLKGKALEAVRCRLLHPANVAGVLSTLKMLYGRPEAIVQAAIRKIRSLPSPEIDRLESLVNFALTVENLVATIEACGVQEFVYNASLKFELIERLPPTLKLDWAKHTRGNQASNLADFSSWLYAMAEDASAVMQTSCNTPRSRSNNKDAFINVHSEPGNSRSGSPVAPAQDTRAQWQGSQKECFTCKGSCPSIAKCKRFIELSYESKWAVIREAKLCRKCLRKHNGTCRHQNNCGVNGCTFLHHPLLHSERTESPRSFSKVDAATNTSCNIHQAQTNNVLFRIVPVMLHGPSKSIQTYAFIDDGSELTLMEHSLAQELGLQGSQKALSLKWTGGTSRMENISQKVEVDISSTKNTSQKYKLADVRTIRELNLRPQTLIASEVQNRYSHLAAIPFDSYTDVCPRILIGLDHAHLGYAFKSREGKPSEPIAVKTRLGWIVYGSCSSNHHFGSHVNYHAVQLCECNESSDEGLHTAMKNYFTLDSTSKPEKLLLSAEDQRAMGILEGVTIPKDDRFESDLLWKYDVVRLPDSKAMAIKRWEYRAKDAELRAHMLTLTPTAEPIISPQNSSKWTTMLRSTAYVLRYIWNSKQMVRTEQRTGGPPPQQELARVSPQPPTMSDLSPSRLAAYSRPFTHMGVDYFGLIIVSVNRKMEKRWVLMATCLIIRALHLQIAHTLSTDSCIMALRNVIGRRGTPAVVYSDQGTNFQGANKEQKADAASLDQERLMIEFTTPHTSWSFNPPASPHMGGAWERLIYTVEVVENLLVEVKNVVNSRPLISIPLEAGDSLVLTANHFLLRVAPFDESPMVLRNCWQLSLTLTNQFWRQWVRDYLPAITRRTKWFTPAKSIEAGDIVVDVDPEFPCNCWPKGRVITTKPGADGQVRCATVQTASSIYECPVVKLAVLDVGACKDTPQDNHRRIPGGSVDPATSSEPTSTNISFAANSNARSYPHPCAGQRIVDHPSDRVKGK